MSQAKPHTLYEHVQHPHQPRNVNHLHRAERQEHSQRSRVAAFNERLAVQLTKHTGTMPTAYVFAGIGIGSLIGVFTNNVFLAALCGSLSSYFLQLVLLPILSVGQNVLSRHAELQADETFHDVERILHDLEQVAHHLDAQDAEAIEQRNRLMRIEDYLQSLHFTPTSSRVVGGVNSLPLVVASSADDYTPAAPPVPGATGAKRRRRRRASAARKQETRA